ncbi:MAG: 30S ribosomal protein S21 [Anaerolineae bacterium]|nr:30S ribosomal protein S21 [Anaerolineae bacterium]
MVVTVELRTGESFESLLKRFRKEVTKTGVLSAYRRRQWFVSKSEQRRRERQKAARKLMRKMWKQTSGRE